MPVHVRVEARSSDSARVAALVRRFAVRMLSALTLERAELSLLLCDDRVMRRLNREHRRIDRTTDVLAFSMNEGRPMVSAAELLGDIAISWPTVQRQARAHGWSAERELCLMLAHGLLHLLGFDHATRVEERRMTARAHMLMAAALSRATGVDKARRRHSAASA